MGSSPSKGKKAQSSEVKDTSKYGQIFLKTDKTTYYPGDTVTGTIFVNLISDYPGNQLFLKFEGKEVAHIRGEKLKTIRTGKHTNHYTEYKKASGKRQIINCAQAIHSWEKLSPGQFSFPFSFLIPTIEPVMMFDTLPTSFYQQGVGFLAFIEYQVEAFLQPFSDKSPKMKFKQPLRIRQREKLDTENLVLQKNFSLVTCEDCQDCQCKAGSITLKAKFQKQYYSPGEIAKVLVEVENSNTKLRPEKIKFSLEHWLNFHVGNEELYKFHTKTKVKQAFAQTTIDSEVKTRSLSLTLPRFITKDDYERTNEQDNLTDSQLRNLSENPNGITSSTTEGFPIGALISSKFYLRVSCLMNRCCTTNPSVDFPIVICPPELKLPPLSLPLNWQPEIFENKHIIVSPIQIELPEIYIHNQMKYSHQHNDAGINYLSMADPTAPIALPEGPKIQLNPITIEQQSDLKMMKPNLPSNLPANSLQI